MSETPTPSTAPSIKDARKMGAEGGPTVEAERIAFEAWMEGHCWSLADVSWTGEQYRGGAERGGIVDAYAVQIRGLWAAWRDRAALAADALTAERAARERAEAERDALRVDAERLAWMERLFERKWDGTLGRPSSWHICGPYRHFVQHMRGETFHEAIDAARKERP